MKAVTTMAMGAWFIFGVFVLAWLGGVVWDFTTLTDPALRSEMLQRPVLIAAIFSVIWIGGLIALLALRTNRP
ncbi:MAG: hypothetical protein J0H17_01440 [Rhizobiales bacterium]|nr:hypothetical protein [Hyphomicrobiales bacterium]